MMTSADPFLTLTFELQNHNCMSSFGEHQGTTTAARVIPFMPSLQVPSLKLSPVEIEFTTLYATIKLLKRVFGFGLKNTDLFKVLYMGDVCNVRWWQSLKTLEDINVRTLDCSTIYTKPMIMMKIAHSVPFSNNVNDGNYDKILVNCLSKDFALKVKYDAQATPTLRGIDLYKIDAKCKTTKH